MNLFTKQKQTQGLREITYGYQRERVKGRIDWEFEIDMYIISVQSFSRVRLFATP